MTRRDYIRVAEMVNEAWPLNVKQTRPARLGFFLRAMASYMKEDNPKGFDPDRFLRACGEWTGRLNAKSTGGK